MVCARGGRRGGERAGVDGGNGAGLGAGGEKTRGLQRDSVHGEGGGGGICGGGEELLRVKRQRGTDEDGVQRRGALQRRIKRKRRLVSHQNLWSACNQAVQQTFCIPFQISDFVQTYETANASSYIHIIYFKNLICNIRHTLQTNF